MTELLGSEYEMALRYLLLLNKAAAISCEQVCSLDYMATYADDFGLEYENINGCSPYRFGEYPIRRCRADEVLRQLDLRGLVEVDATNDGLVYRISSAGTAFCRRLHSVYATDYSLCVAMVLGKYGSYDADRLNALVLAFVDKMTKEGCS